MDGADEGRLWLLAKAFDHAGRRQMAGSCPNFRDPKCTRDSGLQCRLKLIVVIAFHRSLHAILTDPHVDNSWSDSFSSDVRKRNDFRANEKIGWWATDYTDAEAQEEKYQLYLF